MMDFSALKKRQQYLLWGAGSFLMGGLMVYGWTSMREVTVGRSPELKSSLITGSSRINPQEAWIYKFGAEAEIARKRLDAMETILAKILKINEQGVPSPSSSGDFSHEAGTLAEELKAYQKGEPSPEEGTQTKGLERVSQRASQGEAVSSSLLPPSPGDLPAPVPFRSKTVRKVTLSLRNARSTAPLKTVDNTLPAGAFARAVLLSGVDASASIQASSDPRPALLRLTDWGTLPRKFPSDLKGCHALAAAYGDLSSERVYMRLEKLTCTERKTGEVVEVKVQGYVAGEDGRTGVRGSVVDRAGESMRNVMVGGFLGGLGEFLGQARNPVAFSPMSGLAQANPLGMGDMVKHGAGKGINSALDKYADFYIRRAEQIQPVIQVAAGRQVDIVFTEGIALGDSLYRQALGRANDQNRYQQIQTVNTVPEEGSPKPLADWSSENLASAP